MLQRMRDQVDLQQHEAAVRLMLRALEKGAQHLRRRLLVAP